VIEEKEEIWIAEVVTAEMTEEAAAVKEEAAVVVVEIEEVVAVQEVAVAKVEEVEDLVVVVEVAVVEEQAVAAEEEDKFEIKTKIKNKKLVTRNFIKCYNRKDRNTGKCRKAV
jgi:hypothetical protein